eukprot:SAG25_NODE_13977_length_260_cov_0.968944_1_plen_30_part_10
MVGSSRRETPVPTKAGAAAAVAPFRVEEPA